MLWGLFFSVAEADAAVICWCPSGGATLWIIVTGLLDVNMLCVCAAFKLRRIDSMVLFSVSSFEKKLFVIMSTNLLAITTCWEHSSSSTSVQLCRNTDVCACALVSHFDSTSSWHFKYSWSSKYSNNFIALMPNPNVDVYLQSKCGLRIER